MKYFRCIFSAVLLCVIFSFCFLSVEAKPSGDTYTIAYDCGNDDVFSDHHKDTDEFFVKESSFESMNGQRFAYWVDSLDGSGTKVYPYDVIRLDYNITLYAVYDSSVYRITYIDKPVIENDDIDDETSVSESSRVSEETSVHQDISKTENSIPNTSKPSDISHDGVTSDTDINRDNDDLSEDVTRPDVRVYTKDDKVTIKEPGPIDGYDFVNWNTKPDGTGVPYYPGDEIDPEKQLYNVTLYPIFRRSYSKTSIVSESSVVSSDPEAHTDSSVALGKHDPDEDIINKHLLEGDVWLDSNGQTSIHDIDKSPTYNFDPAFMIISVIVIMVISSAIVFLIVFLKKK